MTVVRPGPAIGGALLFAIRLATLELKLEAFVRALERRYRPDQPRVPAGRPEGGEWTRVGGSQGENRTRTALAGVLIDQRIGVGDGKLVRMCTYQDMFGYQYSFEIPAENLCPPTYPTKPY